MYDRGEALSLWIAGKVDDDLLAFTELILSSRSDLIPMNVPVLLSNQSLESPSSSRQKAYHSKTRPQLL